MPFYEYRTPDGSMVEEYRKVHERDCVPEGWQRVPFPTHALVCPQGEPTQEQQVLHGFKRWEEQVGTSGVERGVGMKSDFIKNVWNKPMP